MSSRKSFAVRPESISSTALLPTINPNKQNIRVLCRVRPLNDQNSSVQTSLDYQHDNNVTVNIDLASQQLFSFDKVFTPTTSQLDVFEDSTKPLIDDILAGYNATVFAYGQTGAGKTFTMEGDINNDLTKGIIPRAITALFDGIAALHDRAHAFTIKVSFVEIYMEKIRDLLDRNNRAGNLPIRENRLRGIHIDGASEEVVHSVEELLYIMRLGAKNRAMAATEMNEGSSRSHSVFSVTVEHKDLVTRNMKLGKLVLVDLAGSEIVSKSHAAGLQLAEAIMINKSLSALGNVINALTDEKVTHIPYRDSKLTRLLQNALGGNAKTVLIIAISPATYNLNETISTLRFGTRAKRIQNKITVNQTRSAVELESLLGQAQRMIEMQTKKNVSLMNQLELLQHHLHSPSSFTTAHASETESIPYVPSGSSSKSTSPCSSSTTNTHSTTTLSVSSSNNTSSRIPFPTLTTTTTTTAAVIGADEVFSVDSSQLSLNFAALESGIHEVVDLQEQLDSLTYDYEEKESEANDWQIRWIDLQNELGSIQEQFRKEMTQKEENIQQLQLEYAQMKKQWMKERYDHVSTKHQRDALQTEVVRLGETISQKDSAYQLLQSQYNEDRNLWENKFVAQEHTQLIFQAKYDELMKQVNSQTRLSLTQEIKYQESQTAFKATEAKLLSITAENELLQQQKQAIEVLLHTIEEEIQQLQHNLLAKEEEIVSLKASLVVIQQERDHIQAELYEESILHHESIEQRDQLIDQLTKQYQEHLEEEERIHQCTQLEYALADYIKQRTVVTTEYRHLKIRAATKLMSLTDTETTRCKYTLPETIQEIEQKIQATKEAIDRLHENTQYTCDWYHHHHNRGTVMISGESSGVGFAEGEENATAYCTPTVRGVGGTMNVSQPGNGMTRACAKDGYHHSSIPGTSIILQPPLSANIAPSSSAAHIEKIRGKLGFFQRTPTSTTPILDMNHVSATADNNMMQ